MLSTRRIQYPLLYLSVYASLLRVSARYLCLLDDAIATLQQEPSEEPEPMQPSVSSAPGPVGPGPRGGGHAGALLGLLQLQHLVFSLCQTLFLEVLPDFLFYYPITLSAFPLPSPLHPYPLQSRSFLFHGSLTCSHPLRKHTHTLCSNILRIRMALCFDWIHRNIARYTHR